MTYKFKKDINTSLLLPPSPIRQKSDTEEASCISNTHSFVSLKTANEPLEPRTADLAFVVLRLAILGSYQTGSDQHEYIIIHLPSTKRLTQEAQAIINTSTDSYQRPTETMGSVGIVECADWNWLAGGKRQPGSGNEAERLAHC